jgi:hypothetical protein
MLRRRTILRRLPILLGLLVCCGLAACADRRRDTAEAIARDGGLTARKFDAGAFVLAGWQRPTAPATTLTIYLEGDGSAWVNRGRLAEDPTPRDPLALRLAAADPARAVLYLARPCQYVEGSAARGCVPHYWSGGRLAPVVVDATSRALDLAKAESGATELELVGYSGGGALAALVAARRHDVTRLVTVAANLDLAAWTRHHRVSPMTDSLDPIDVAHDIARVPQIHFAGGADEIVPSAIIESYRRASGNDNGILLITLPNYTHECCWVDNWPRLIAHARSLATAVSPRP